MPEQPEVTERITQPAGAFTVELVRGRHQHRRAGRDRIPPFVMTIQEGGELNSFPDLPPAESPGDLPSVREAARQSRLSARTLRSLGLTGVLGPVVVLLMRALFGIPLWIGALTVPLAVVLGFMAARITGETDTTPTKAFGPLTQLMYGGLLPGQLVPNLMGANVTGGIGLHAADLLTDLKSGYLLGARPRPQLAAQLLALQVNGKDVDYVNRRSDLIEAVTIADIARVAQRLVVPGDLTLVVAGRPEGVASSD